MACPSVWLNKDYPFELNQTQNISLRVNSLCHNKIHKRRKYRISIGSCLQDEPISLYESTLNDVKQMVDGIVPKKAHKRYVTLIKPCKEKTKLGGLLQAKSRREQSAVYFTNDSLF
jgi:hypothetical protein